MNLSLPNYEAPEGVQPGAEFEALATLTMNEDGSFTLLKIDDTPVGGEAEEEVEVAEGAAPAAEGRMPMPWDS